MKWYSVKNVIITGRGDYVEVYRRKDFYTGTGTAVIFIRELRLL